MQIYLVDYKYIFEIIKYFHWIQNISLLNIKYIFLNIEYFSSNANILLIISIFSQMSNIFH